MQYKPTHLVHLAWTATPGTFWDDPANELWREASTRLIEIAVSAGVQHIIGMGTSAEYAWTGQVCNEETTPIEPASAYGKAKATLHATARPLCTAASIPLAWLRLFFPYGPDEPEQKFLSYMIRSAYEKSEIVLKDPNRRLDLIHIDDVISAIKSVVEARVDTTVNVAQGRGVRLRDLAEIVVNGVRRGNVRIVEEAPPQPAPDVIATVHRLVSLGWEPVRDLNESVRAMTRSITQLNKDVP